MAKVLSRKSAVWVGRVLMGISLVFITLRLWDYRYSVEEQLASPKALLSTLLASLIYGLSGFFLALGWWLILGSRVSWGEGLPWKSGWHIYGKTQIAKYLPGNIFHFAGRHVLAARQGASHPQLIMAATGEIAMMLAASAFFSLLAIENLLKKIPHHSLLAEIIAGCVFVGLVILCFISRRSGMQNIIRGIDWRKVFGAQLSYCSFVAVSLLLFLFLLFQIRGPFADWPLVAGGSALAWAIGFVIPGAPGGMGVREAMLVTFLSGVAEAKSVLVTAILFRIVTTLGDLLFFLIASAKAKTI